MPYGTPSMSDALGKVPYVTDKTNLQLFTSESVTEGHPDKICDRISDSILDALLEQDCSARVAVETMVTTGLVHVAGEVTTKKRTSKFRRLCANRSSPLVTTHRKRASMVTVVASQSRLGSNHLTLLRG